MSTKTDLIQFAYCISRNDSDRTLTTECLFRFLEYKIDRNQENFVTETFGYWDNEIGLSDLRPTRILSRRRRNLQEKILKSSVILIRNESINELDTLKYDL